MSSFRDKMLNYESVPPRDTWDKIAAALDEAHSGAQFPSRLHALEVVPPAMAWDKISDSLEQDDGPRAVIVNHPSKFRQIFRYAAAAVIIGAIAFGILRWTGTSTNKTNGAALAGVQSDSGRTDNATALFLDTMQTTGNQPTEEVIVVEQNKKLLTKLDPPARTQDRKLASLQEDNYYSPANKASSAIYTYNDHVPLVADRYIMLMTPDGNLIRMSKKWGNLVCCVSGEDPEADCKTQLKKWQQKMATSSLTTSAGNFMDIINLVSALDEGSDL